jgi:hypothetical protein
MVGGVNVMSKVTAFSLIVTMSVFLSACEDGGRSIQGLFSVQTLGWNPSASGTGAVFKVANKLESAADKLSSHTFAKFKQLDVSHETDTQSCEVDNTAIITVYSTNGMAQNEIDVKLDGSHIGSLTTYFPNEEPSCKTPSAEGIISLMVPAGKHVLEAASSNLNWPGHTFSVEKCVCMVLPLS